MPFIVLPRGGDEVDIGQKNLGKKDGIDVMTKLKAPVLKAQERQDGDAMELTARFVVEANDGAVLRSPMAVTACVPGGDEPDDVDNEVAPSLPPCRLNEP